jgi:hypothetical protein
MRRGVAAVLLAVGVFAYGVLLAWFDATPGRSHAAPADSPRHAAPADRAPHTAPTTRTFETLRGRDGYWRLGRDAAGVWWFVSPDGRAEFLNGVTTVQPRLLGRDQRGPHYVSRDWKGDDASPAARRQWAEATLARVKGLGFKGMGAWCDPVFHGYDVPVARDLNLSTYLVGEERDVFSPQWERRVEQIIRDQVVPLRDSRSLVGYYTDNELEWGGAGDDEATYRKARRYFEVTTRLVKKYDPNHLVLGVRFRGDAPAAVVRASAGLTDAQSVNYYPHDAKLDRQLFETLHRLSGGQPVIVSEYSFHALDGRSGNRNTFGFPAQVKDQAARAAGYRDMTTRLARLPYVAGADWFQWMDEPPSGRVRDGEDVNFGVVDVADREYELLGNAVRETTPKLNGLHGGSAGESYADVWRESESAVAGVAD